MKKFSRGKMINADMMCPRMCLMPVDTQARNIPKKSAGWDKRPRNPPHHRKLLMGVPEKEYHE
jgi:hypothetical protein